MTKSNALLNPSVAISVIGNSMPQSSQHYTLTGFFHSNRDAISRIRNLSPKLEQWRCPYEEPGHGKGVYDYVISALSPVSTTSTQPLWTDLGCFSHIVSQVVEATEENIITNEEAEALTGVLASAFVERRINRVML